MGKAERDTYTYCLAYLIFENVPRPVEQAYRRFHEVRRWKEVVRL